MLRKATSSVSIALTFGSSNRPVDAIYLYMENTIRGVRYLRSRNLKEFGKYLGIF